MIGKNFFKRGHIVSDEVIKWIIYLSILIATGFAIKSIILKFGG